MEELRSILGSDVIQILEEGAQWCTIEKEPDNYLSLQYWSEESRKVILRDQAIKIWNEIAEREQEGQEELEDDFERGVNAFGAFRGFDPALVSRAFNHTFERSELTEFYLSLVSDETVR